MQCKTLINKMDGYMGTFCTIFSLFCFVFSLIYVKGLLLLLFLTYFWLAENCFTMLCWFLAYNNAVSHNNTYITFLLSIPPLPPSLPATPGHHRVPGWAPCFMKQLPTSYLFYTWWWAFLVAQLVMNLPAMQETWVQSLSWEDPREKRTATYSSILAWRIPWTV